MGEAKINFRLFSIFVSKDKTHGANKMQINKVMLAKNNNQSSPLNMKNNNNFTTSYMSSTKNGKFLSFTGDYDLLEFSRQEIEEAKKYLKEPFKTVNDVTALEKKIYKMKVRAVSREFSGDIPSACIRTLFGFISMGGSEIMLRAHIHSEASDYAYKIITIIHRLKK